MSQRNMRRLALTAGDADVHRLLPSSTTLTQIAARLFIRKSPDARLR